MTDDPPSDSFPLIDPEFEAWFRSDDMQFPIATVLMSAMLWHVQHRHDWQDPGDDESYEAALHAAVALFNLHLERFRDTR